MKFEPPPKSRAPRLELWEIFHVEKPPADSRVAARSDRVAQALKTSTDGACTSSPGNLCCCFTLLGVKKVFLISTPPPPSFQFLAVVSRLLTTYCCKQQSPPHCDLAGCCKVPPSCLCPCLSQRRSCSLSAQGNCSSPHCLGGPSGLRLFPVLEGPKLASVRMRLNKC